MCTLAFAALPSGGYLLGHNRDERRERARGLPPAESVRDGIAVVHPTDPDAGGTWIGACALGTTLAILNAKEPEGRVLPRAPRSRGLVLLDLLTAGSIAEAVERLRALERDLAAVRSFHLVVAEPGAPGSTPRIARFRWNGVEGEWEESTGPRLFVSSSLSGSGAERARENAWRSFLEGRRSLDVESLAAWLASHEPERGPRSVCMHRPDGGTVSRTLVEVSEEAVVMRYLPGPPCEPEGAERVVRIPRACAPGRRDAGSAPRGRPA
jgi:transport and Golgi organization protein 2